MFIAYRHTSYSYVLMMFYPTITVWVFLYLVYTVRSDFVSLEPAQVSELFKGIITNKEYLFVLDDGGMCNGIFDMCYWLP